MRKTKVFLGDGERDGVASRYLGGESTRKLAKAFGVDQKVIASVLKKRGIVLRDVRKSSRLTTIDETVFDDPGEEGRYWIGYLMADGCVTRDRRHDSWTVSLVASEKDAAHIERFRAFLGSNAAILRRPERVGLMPGGYHSTTRAHVRFSATSKPLATALSRYGVVPRKSLTACVIGLGACPHFWRGAVDGDGTVSWQTIGSKQFPFIQLVGSRDLVRQFYEFAKAAVPGIGHGIERQVNIFKFRTAGRLAASLIRILYGNCTVSLTRKWAVAREVLAQDWSEPPPRLCEVPGCGRLHAARGCCSMHHKKLMKYGSPAVVVRNRSRSPIAKCSVGGCEIPSITKGLCRVHYRASRRAAN
jgi:hypothetical protein